jgi:glucose/arabinose dehydrogenase/mono/diheme cytochrome c family protein
MFGKYQGWITAAMLSGTAGAMIAAEAPRGETLYLEKCAMCHLPAGQGAPPAYPPLAGSDWLLADRTRTIRVVCEGLEGPIKVNGVDFNNIMPAQILQDEEVAAVLTYVTNAWGNKAAPFTADEVKTARAKTKFPTFESLEQAAAYQPLPTAPAGWTVEQTAPLPGFCTRLAGHGKGGPVYLLGERGIIYRLIEGAVVPWIQPEAYADLSKGSVSTMGLTLGPDHRLWLVGNQKVSKGYDVDTNEVTIWRSSVIDGDQAPKFNAWFQTKYPWGVGPYNHGVSHLAFGPDEMLYASSGSRTDGGEEGNSPRIAKTGETPLTACLWRFDPRAEKPEPEVIARGLRNAYGFAWDDAARLFTVSNGPDADAPEEMDVILTGSHYGFPYQFSNWPLTRRPYPHTPAPPEGLTFTHPVLNEGPAAGGGVSGGLGTFDAHSSPAGMIWCGDSFAEPLRGSFLVPRFGNLLSTPQDVGFDLLHVRPYQDSATGQWRAKVTTTLAPLGRPLDVLPDGKGGVYVLEYTRPTHFKNAAGWLPGRLLHLRPASAR